MEWMLSDLDRIGLEIPQGLPNLEAYISRISVKLSECFIGNKRALKRYKYFTDLTEEVRENEKFLAGSQSILLSLSSQ